MKVLSKFSCSGDFSFVPFLLMAAKEKEILNKQKKRVKEKEILDKQKKRVKEKEIPDKQKKRATPGLQPGVTH